MKIVTNKKIENFIVRTTHQDFVGESDDGRRRGYSYTVHSTFSFSFEDEKLEGGGRYSYHLRVVKDTDSYVRGYDMTETEEEFVKNFNFVMGHLFSRGICPLNIPAYMRVKCSLSQRWDSDTDEVRVCLEGRIFPQPEGKTEHIGSLLALMREETKEGKLLSIARAVEDETPYGDYYAPLEELLGRESETFTFPRKSLKALLEEGAISPDDVIEFLEGYVARIKNARQYYPISSGEIREFIPLLPSDEERERVLWYSKPERGTLDLYRAYCPKGINWRKIGIEDYLDSDLDLMIQVKEYAYEHTQWEFLKRSMAKPAMERKIVKHAYVLGRCDLLRIAKNLHECTVEDLLRSVLRYGAENLGDINPKDISCLSELRFDNLERQDYEAAVRLLLGKRCEREENRAEMMALVLKTGLAAGVEEAEIATALQAAASEEPEILTCWKLKSRYEELSFQPGLAWLKAEQDRREEEARALAERRARSNEEVVRWVRASGQLAVRAAMSPIGVIGQSNVHIKDLKEKTVGFLLGSEKRIMPVEGRESLYLLDVEKIKRLRNGVLHLDVHEWDAGWIIGPKGANIKRLTERLNSLGCNLRTIKVHAHAE